MSEHSPEPVSRSVQRRQRKVVVRPLGKRPAVQVRELLPDEASALPPASPPAEASALRAAGPPAASSAGSPAALPAAAASATGGLAPVPARHGYQPYAGWPQPVPLPPGFIQKYWPGPGRTAPPEVLAAVAGTAVVAAASIPLDRPGIGWLLAGLAGAAATGAVARTSDATLPRAARIQRVAWAAATVALLGVGFVRAAGWLFVLCVLTAIVTGSLAVGGGSTVTGLIRSGLAVPFAALRGLPWGVRGLAAVRRGSGTSPARLLVALAVTILLLVVFGALFSSADAAFAEVLDNVLPDINVATVFRWIFVGGVVGLGTLGAAYLVSAPPQMDGAGERSHRRVQRLEWAVPLALLDLLFVAFVLVQLTVLFGGDDHVITTAGLTYAEYARSGFWQLLTVTVLTLLVLGAAARWAPRDGATDRLLIRVLLGLLAGLTLLIVASALYRMDVYQDAYGFTRLRIFVSTVEVWLGVVFLMILVAGVRLRAPWLARAVAASAVIALLGLAALNPDRFIAERNIDRYEAIGKIDEYYLSTLSADAVPALNRIDDPRLRQCTLRDIAADLSGDPDDWRGFNLARETARTILAGNPLAPGRCGGATREDAG